MTEKGISTRGKHAFKKHAFETKIIIIIRAAKIEATKDTTIVMMQCEEAQLQTCIPL